MSANSKQNARERSCSVVDCLTRDRGATGSSPTSVVALCPKARHKNLSLVLVQPRKSHPTLLKDCWWDVKNQTNKKNKQNVWDYHMCSTWLSALKMVLFCNNLSIQTDQACRLNKLREFKVTNKCPFMSMDGRTLVHAHKCFASDWFLKISKHCFGPRFWYRYQLLWDFKFKELLPIRTHRSGFLWCIEKGTLETHLKVRISHLKTWWNFAQ